MVFKIMGKNSTFIEHEKYILFGVSAIVNRVYSQYLCTI